MSTNYRTERDGYLASPARARSPHRRAFTRILSLAVVLLTACTSDAPITADTSSSSSSRTGDASLGLAPPDGKVDVCHHPGASGNIVRISSAALAAHLAHGDYLSTLQVTRDATPSADGAHFANVGDALSAARASRIARGETLTAACRITIVVAEGVWPVTVGAASPTVDHVPLVVDVPDITLHGALVMSLDGAGRATGVGADAGETVLAPVAPLPFTGGVSVPIIVANAHPGGSAGNGLTVEGFVFRSGHNPAVDAGGQAILSLRVAGLTIRGNRFEGGFTESIDLRASSADVIENHLAGTAGSCDVCLAGPGAFRASGNRLLAGGVPGVTVSPTVGLPVPSDVEPYVLPPSAETWADIRNNEVRDHLRIPVGVGIRMEAVGTGAPNVHGSIHAIVQDNVLINNRFGLMVHAAFPTATTDRRGDIEIALGGNTIQGSCQAKLLVSFARHQTALGLASTPYLLNSTFVLSLGGDVAWEDVWFSHPAGFGNTLVVDGDVIANGARQFYSAAGCPGL